MKDFDGHDYTETRVLEELALMESHARDGSAVDAGCACIEEKHLLLIAGLSSEMPTLTSDAKERAYYEGLASLARELRKEIITGDFKRFPSHVMGNPRTRAYLPHNLTACEKTHPEVRAKLSEAIKALEVKCCGKHTTDYSGCSCNPVAVARATVKCPP